MSDEYDIDDIDGIGEKTKKRFEDLGYTEIEDLVDEDPEAFEDTPISKHQAEMAITGANTLTVSFTSASTAREEYLNADRVPTGLDHLDRAIDGGLTRGQFQGVSGETGTGKTQVAWSSLIAAAEHTGQPAIYIETEPGRFAPDRLDRLSNEPDTTDLIHKASAHTLERQLSAYEAVMNDFEGQELSLIVIDSFNGAFRNSGKYEGRETMPQRNKDMRKHLNRVQDMADEHNAPILLANQVYSDVDVQGQHKTVEQREGNVWGSFQYKHQMYFNLALRSGQGDRNTTARIRNHPECGTNEFDIEVTDDHIISKDA